MRILQLVNRVPWPLTDGGNIGVYYYLEGYLAAGNTLSMLAMNTTRHPTDLATLPAIFQQLHHFEAVTVNNDIRPFPAFISLLKGSSYNIDRFISIDYELALQRLLQQEYDVIHLDSLYLTPYLPLIRRHSKAKVVLRLHNAEYLIWERLAQGTGGVKGIYLSMLAKRLKSYELNCINAYDLVLAISEADAALYRSLGCIRPIYVHPFGVDVQSIPEAPLPDTAYAYHLGAMDWLPNQESVDWLLEKVWPIVHRALPQLQLYLAGRNTPQRYLSGNWPGVTVVGEVPDAAAFEQDKSFLLVPLQSGGGVRIKIFQGMAQGKVVITTPVGIEGIAATDGKEALLAATPEIFAEKIIYAAMHPKEAAVMGKAARKLMEEKYDKKKLMTALMDQYQWLLNQ